LFERATALRDVERIRHAAEGAQDRARQILGRNTCLTQRVLDRANVAAAILYIIHSRLHRVAELTDRGLAGVGRHAAKTRGNAGRGDTSGAIGTCGRTGA
jgi:hypothetical protein